MQTVHLRYFWKRVNQTLTSIEANSLYAIARFLSSLFHEIINKEIIYENIISFSYVFMLYNNANHASIAVIHNLLHGFLQFHLTFFSYHGNLI